MNTFEQAHANGDGAIPQLKGVREGVRESVRGGVREGGRNARREYVCRGARQYLGK